MNSLILWCLVVLVLLFSVVVYVSRGRVLVGLTSMFTPTPPQRPGLLKELHRRIKLVDPAFAHIPLDEASASFTVSKRSIHLCLDNPITKEPYSIDVLMYVLLHELAHVTTVDYVDHGDSFKANFAVLLQRAYEAGVYDPYHPIPVDYCGINE